MPTYSPLTGSHTTAKDPLPLSSRPRGTWSASGLNAHSVITLTGRGSSGIEEHVPYTGELSIVLCHNIQKFFRRLTLVERTPMVFHDLARITALELRAGEIVERREPTV